MENTNHGTSLVVQWLRLRASNAEGMGSIPGRGTRIPHALRHHQKNPTKQNTNHMFFKEICIME